MGALFHPAFILLPPMLASFRDRRLQERKTKMCLLRKPVRVRSGIKTVALIAFGGYVVWNVTWLSHGRFPPSIFAFCVGLPCPTTGITRSILSLWHGNLRDFIFFNPFTTIYIGLAGISAFILLRHSLYRQEVVLPNCIGWAWFFVLFCGWLTKFALGSKYW